MSASLSFASFRGLRKKKKREESDCAEGLRFPMCFRSGVHGSVLAMRQTRRTPVRTHAHTPLTSEGKREQKEQHRASRR